MPARIIAVVNRKGGVGKTTSAIALAHGLSRKVGDEEGVLLVDLDPQGNCVTALGLKPNGHGDVADLLLGTRPLKDCLLAADRATTGGPSRPNLFVVAANDRLAQARTQILFQSLIAQTSAAAGPAVPIDQVLGVRLAKAAQIFTYIILDCPPSLDVLERAVYNFAGEAVVPVKVDFLGASGARQHTANIINAQAQGIDIKISLVVPTFVRPREVLAKEVLSALIKQYGRTRVAYPIPQAVALEQAPAAGGQTIFEYAPGSPAAAAYQRLVDQVHGGSSG